MEFTTLTRCTIILLLWSFWGAPGAAASEPQVPSSASEPDEAPPAAALPAGMPPAADPVPLLLHLYAADDAHGLRTEALRVGFAGGLDPVTAGEVRYLGALALMQLGEQDAGLLEMDRLVRLDPTHLTGQMAQLRVADAWLELAPPMGVSRHRAFLDAYPDSPLRDYAAYQSAVGLTAEGQFAMALTVLDAEGVMLAPEHRMKLEDPRRWKRPMVASMLSGALPGAGQLYARAPQEAASALLINSLFITSMALTARRQSWPAFGVLAFFGVGFYMGNIYGAADAAIRYNRGVRDEALDALGPYAPPEPLPYRDPPPGEPAP